MERTRRRLARGIHARERTPSNAWARKMQAPTRPIKAVTVSNIANVLCVPQGQNDAQARTVKGIRGHASKSEPTGDSAQQVYQKGAPIGRHCGPSPVRSRLANSTIDSPWLGLPISAAFRLRYLGTLVAEVGRGQAEFR
jgi:hypothetical protein